MIQIIGQAGVSLIDAWTLAHLAFWLFFGSICWAVRGPREAILPMSFALSLFWEVFERYAEYRWPMIWSCPERWWNSWITDPATSLIGIVLMYWLLDRYGGRSK